MTSRISLIDMLIVGGCLVATLLIGLYFSRRQTGTSSFFLGGGKMPGWLVGFSILASMISTMTFLAIPGFTFKEDYRWVLPSFSFLIMAIFAMVVLVPFFRGITTPSGYTFLEQRFGIWARVYAAGGFMLFNLLRLGVVLYVTSLSLEIFLGIPTLWLMVILGIVTTLYTMMGGFEAVVWTEFFQALVLVAGAAILVPAAVNLVPGGFNGVIDLAYPAGKMSLGSMEFNFAEKTIWVMILASLFINASDYTTRQDFIQRYRAATTIGQARIALAIAAFTVVPVWLYFNFLGTALWAFYQTNPDPVVSGFAETAPEKIVPYFMLTHLPQGLNGVVLAALLMAALSTLAPILNACAVTWIGDFHQRFISSSSDERHYLKLGRIATGIFGLLTIFIAIWIHAVRTQTLQDLQATGAMVFSAGLFGLFLLGFFSARTGRRSALLATGCTIALVIAWVILNSTPVQSAYPELSGWIPDTFWVPVISNILLPTLALLFSRIFNDPLQDLGNLTFYTTTKTNTSVTNR